MEIENSGIDENLYYLAYRSTAKANISSDEIDYILANAKVSNMRENVTGALLFDGSDFFQFIEGPKRSLDEIYDCIQQSSKHHSIKQVAYNPSNKRYFNNWHMGFCEAPSSVLQQASEAHWVMSAAAIKETTRQVDGLTLLLDFWKGADGA